MLFRSLRRKYSVESQDVDEICDTEFRNPRGGFDLAVSVYRLEAPYPLAQIHAEHAATAKRESTGAWRHADLRDAHAAALVAAPTDGPFALARRTHHEIQFQTPEQLREMVRAAWADPGRFAHLEKAIVREYVRARLRDGDAEWTSFCIENATWRSWAA